MPDGYYYLVYEDVAHKHQTKLNDCWYACIQMILSTRERRKVKPAGNTAATHRAVPIAGQRLVIQSDEMDAIMRDNHLIDLSERVDLDDAKTIYTALSRGGPFMVGGSYGAVLRVPRLQYAAGRFFGHFIVVSGVDSINGRVRIHDPALWGPTWMSMDELRSLAFGGGADANSIIGLQ